MYAVNEAKWCAPTGMPASQEFGEMRRGNGQSHRSHQESGAHWSRKYLGSHMKTRSPKKLKSIGTTVVVVIFAICLAVCIWPGLYPNTSALLGSNQHYPARLLASLEVEETCDVDPAEVIGLEYCPELEQMVPTFMEIKRSLLRLGIDAASDAGESPLMLLSILIKERADLLFSSAYLSEESGAVDGWLAEQHNARQKTESENLLYNTSTEFVPELFLDRIDGFYVEDLGRSRPVVVYVNGHDLCDLWDELTSHGGASPTSAEDPGLQVSPESEADGTRGDIGDKTPLVLLTLGWDGNGSPFYHNRWECSLDVLELPQVMLWIVSHGEGYPPSPKVKFVPIGFGGTSSISGLPQSQVVGYLKEKLHRLESNPCLSGEKMEILFMCNNNSSNTPRPAINDALEKFDSSDGPARVVPNNHFPLDPADTAESSTNGIFAVSPPGTRPDCFRHYELLLSGNIVYLPDDPSLRLILSGLPVVFVHGVKGAAGGWGNITCDAMAEHARHVHQRLQDGMRQETVPAFNYAKLMFPYWSRFIRDVVWEAGEQLRQAHSGILPEDYLSPNDYPAEMVVGP